MTMNSSGPISLGGTVPGQSIAKENCGPGTAQISLNCTAVRSLAGVPGSGTTIIMPTNFYGKSNIVNLNLTISANTQNYNVLTNTTSNPSYVAGKTNVTVTVNPGIVVGGPGGYAMLVPNGFNPGDTVRIVNNGYIVGNGGPGGGGGSAGGPYSPGSPGGGGSNGGNALYVNRPTTVTNNGTIGAGGGGGGGGGGSGQGNFKSYSSSGGGGGGGAGNTVGSGGSGGSGPPGNNGSPGGSGSTTGGGSGGGGSGSGGPGGGLGAAGATGGDGSSCCYFPGCPDQPPTVYGGGGGAGGGASANYITGNPFVTWPATGTRLGGVA